MVVYGSDGDLWYSERIETGNGNRKEMKDMLEQGWPRQVRHKLESDISNTKWFRLVK